MSADTNPVRSVFVGMFQAFVGAAVGGVALCVATFAVCAIAIGLDGWDGLATFVFSFYAGIIGAIIGAIAWPIRCAHVSHDNRGDQ